MNQISQEDCYDDVSKLESKVVLALSRLQTCCNISNRNGKFQGIDSQQVVEYLCAQYCYLDGDIESQVITALLSCVKSGIICALENGKYQLLGPGSKTIISNCLTRASHGPKCYCLKVLENLPSIASNTCCYLRMGVASPKTKVTKTIDVKKKKIQCSGAKKKKLQKKKDVRRKSRAECVQNAEKILEKKNPPKGNIDPKCDYCHESHPSPTRKKGKKPCSNCYPLGTRLVVPLDKFSPREEVKWN